MGRQQEKRDGSEFRSISQGSRRFPCAVGTTDKCSDVEWPGFSSFRPGRGTAAALGGREWLYDSNARLAVAVLP